MAAPINAAATPTRPAVNASLLLFLLSRPACSRLGRSRAALMSTTGATSAAARARASAAIAASSRAAKFAGMAAGGIVPKSARPARSALVASSAASVAPASGSARTLGHNRAAMSSGTAPACRSANTSSDSGGSPDMPPRCRMSVIGSPHDASDEYWLHQHAQLGRSHPHSGSAGAPEVWPVSPARARTDS